MKFPEDMNKQLSEQFNCNVNLMLDLAVEGAETLRAPFDESLEFVQVLNGNKGIIAQFKQLLASIELVHDTALQAMAKQAKEKEEQNE